MSRATQDAATAEYDSYTQLSCSLVNLSRLFYSHIFARCRSPSTPIMPKHNRFGLLRVRSPLLAESLLFSLPLGT